MNHRELKAMMTELAPIIRDYVEAGLKEPAARLAEMEKRMASLDGLPAKSPEPVTIHDATIDGATLTLILADGRTVTHELAGRL